MMNSDRICPDCFLPLSKTGRDGLGRCDHARITQVFRVSDLNGDPTPDICGDGDDPWPCDLAPGHDGDHHSRAYDAWCEEGIDTIRPEPDHFDPHGHE
ncbi:hypothetical protein AB0I72_23350 [Nocardiopsis sp. NPDC049922]|uniref:hypothetical protein n=1 Tax=Nocardiopsis sp. NPDC049922 TaxID=3155157 RepID=UPI0033EC0F56